jgi:hypothetical protein
MWSINDVRNCTADLLQTRVGGRTKKLFPLWVVTAQSETETRDGSQMTSDREEGGPGEWVAVELKVKPLWEWDPYRGLRATML